MRDSTERLATSLSSSRCQWRQQYFAGSFFSGNAALQRRSIDGRNSNSVATVPTVLLYKVIFSLVRPEEVHRVEHESSWGRTRKFTG